MIQIPELPHSLQITVSETGLCISKKLHGNPLTEALGKEVGVQSCAISANLQFQISSFSKRRHRIVAVPTLVRGRLTVAPVQLLNVQGWCYTSGIGVTSKRAFCECMFRMKRKKIGKLFSLAMIKGGSLLTCQPPLCSWQQM